jgi:hypothetical protein
MHDIFVGAADCHPFSSLRKNAVFLPSRNRQMDYAEMKTKEREPRSIKDILLDIAEDPNDDYGKTLRKLSCIQKGLNERRNRRHDNKK